MRGWQRKMQGGLIFGVLCALVAGGCSSASVLASRRVTADETCPDGGVSYYLPKRIVTLTVWGIGEEPPEGAEHAAPSPTPFDPPVPAAQPERAAPDPMDALPAPVIRRPGGPALSPEELRAPSSSPEPPIPDPSIPEPSPPAPVPPEPSPHDGGHPTQEEDASKQKQGVRYFATFDGVKTVPDLRHQFLIVPEFDEASHDAVQVSLTDAGLLQSVQGKSDDKRAEIAHELGKLASLLIQGAAGVPSAPVTRAILERTPTRPFAVATYQFDPTERADLERVRDALAKRGIALDIAKQSDCPVATEARGRTPSAAESAPGVYYRLPIPYRMRLSPGGLYRKPGTPGAPSSGSWELLTGGIDETVLLPNEALRFYVPVDRRRFVTSQTAMTFDEGMLRSVSTDKPSELLGFVKIPVDVAQQILAVPSELLTLRIAQAEQEAKLADAEAKGTRSNTSKVEAELELLEAWKKYQEAQGGDDGK